METRFVLIYRLLLAIIFLLIIAIATLFYIQSNKEKVFYCGVKAEDYPSALSRKSSGYNYNKTGKDLFENNCQACHSINEIIVGPPLADIFEKEREIEWVYKFIQDPKKLIESGDTSAISVYIQYEKMMMPSFESLSTSEIDSLLEYIKYASSPIY